MLDELNSNFLPIYIFFRLSSTNMINLVFRVTENFACHENEND